MFLTEVFSMAESLADEVRNAQFGDQRLGKRLGIIADRLAAKPNMSIPAAMNGRAEMEAAYRLSRVEYLFDTKLVILDSERL